MTMKLISYCRRYCNIGLSQDRRAYDEYNGDIYIMKSNRNGSISF